MSAPRPSRGVLRKLASDRKSSNLDTSIPARLLFVFAHPDDETIAASMLLSRAREARVAFLTDGAPHDRRFWSSDATASRREYAELRAREARNALRVAGVQEKEITWLGAIDQEAIEGWESLTTRTAELVLDQRPDAVVTHAYEGGHPDHDAAALIARLAVEAAAGLGVQCELLDVPLYHARDEQFVPLQFLDSAEVGHREAGEWIFHLSPEWVQRKREMMRCHHSQRRVLEAFPLAIERVRTAPVYDFTHPPHSGKLWYECLGWPMTGDEWREIATRAAARLQRLPCR